MSMICHEHLEYYALKQIQYIAGECGLKIVDVELNDVNGGQFFGDRGKSIIRLPGSNGPRIPLCCQPDTSPATIPAHRSNNLGKIWRSTVGISVHSLKTFGGTVPVRATAPRPKAMSCSSIVALIAQCYRISREVNPDKFGELTPGTRIPDHFRAKQGTEDATRLLLSATLALSRGDCSKGSCLLGIGLRGQLFSRFLV